MQTVRTHIQVGARYDRSPPALVPDYTILHRAALMPDLMSPPSGFYRRVMLLITICSGRPTVSLRKSFISSSLQHLSFFSSLLFPVCFHHLDEGYYQEVTADRGA